MYPPDLRSDPSQALEVPGRAIRLRSTLEHGQRGIVLCYSGQHCPQLLACARRVQRSPHAVQAMHQVTEVLFRSRVGVLRLRPVAGLLQIQQRLVAGWAPGVVVRH
jgi:hypothetical protein